MHHQEITVLIIEDERPLAQAIKSKLEKEGIVAISARSVEQGLGYLNDSDFEKIDLIWLDHYLLGDKTGIDFMAECRAQSDHLQSIPIFVVTNTGSHDKKQSYIKFGASKYYIKANHRLDQIIDDIKACVLRGECSVDANGTPSD